MPSEREIEQEAVLQVARLMCVAARTAPKARGTDNLVIKILTEETEKKNLAQAMRRFAETVSAPFFARDAANLEAADACVLIGTRLKRFQLPGCNLCGHDGCEASEKANARCSFNAGDLGIALGSAVGIAAMHHVDCRIMYTIGRVAVAEGLMGDDVHIAHAIPLSARGKNPFFDRT